MVFGGCLAGEEEIFREYDLVAALFEKRTPPGEIKVEVKIDTGMSRLGIPWEEAAAFIRQLDAPVVGLFSHFASASQDPGFTRLQLQRFEQSTADLEYPRHISHSAGLQYPEAHLDAVRLGLALYGIAPCPAVDYVKPALCWKTRIISLKDVPNGQPIGYGGSFVTGRDSRVGVLPIGYGDGYSRRLSNRGQVRIGQQLVPVLGQVSMDLTCIDLTDVPQARVGEEVLLLEDSFSSPISAKCLADVLGTIPYEIVTSIGGRVARCFV